MKVEGVFACSHLRFSSYTQFLAQCNYPGSAAARGYVMELSSSLVWTTLLVLLRGPQVSISRMKLEADDVS